MPIVKNSDLPTFERLIAENRPILPEGRAITQDIRELHIGFLNMMPDAALEATERQWFRLIGESNRVAQIYIHPFTLPVIERSAETQKHLDQYYEPFETIQRDGLDALIITGANEDKNPVPTDSDSWADLVEVIDWAYENVTSTIYACLACHVLMAQKYGQKPIWHTQKQFDVFTHHVLDRQHPLVRGMNTKMDLPHARNGEVTRAQFDAAHFQTLIESQEAGVHLAVSPDGFRQICFQGHPEYDMFSLLKEYKRDVSWYVDGTIETYPEPPQYYFGPKAQDLLAQMKDKIMAGEKPPFPVEALTALIENTWADSARSLISSWIGHVYQVTNVERTKPFMEGIDPNNPLGI